MTDIPVQDSDVDHAVPVHFQHEEGSVRGGQFFSREGEITFDVLFREDGLSGGDPADLLADTLGLAAGTLIVLVLIFRKNPR